MHKGEMHITFSDLKKASKMVTDPIKKKFTNIVSGSYRGNAWTGTSRDTSKGMVGVWTGSSYRFVVRVASVDVDVEDFFLF
mgnify:CR=1 FL=1